MAKLPVDTCFNSYIASLMFVIGEVIILFAALKKADIILWIGIIVSVIGLTWIVNMVTQNKEK